MCPVVLVNKVPRSFQNLFHSSSQPSVAKCRDRKFCLSSVSSKFFTLRHLQLSSARDYWPSDLCIIAFQICARINALKILHVNVFRGFSKNTKYSDIPSQSFVCYLNSVSILLVALLRTPHCPACEPIDPLLNASILMEPKIWHNLDTLLSVLKLRKNKWSRLKNQIA